MDKKEPLKNKGRQVGCEECIGYEVYFKEEDIKSAVGWFEKEIVRNKLWIKRCGQYAKNCPVCEFYKILDKAFGDV